MDNLTLTSEQRVRLLNILGKDGLGTSYYTDLTKLPEYIETHLSYQNCYVVPVIGNQNFISTSSVGEPCTGYYYLAVPKRLVENTSKEYPATFYNFYTHETSLGLLWKENQRYYYSSTCGQNSTNSVYVFGPRNLNKFAAMYEFSGGMLLIPVGTTPFPGFVHNTYMFVPKPAPLALTNGTLGYYNDLGEAFYDFNHNYSSKMTQTPSTFKITKENGITCVTLMDDFTLTEKLNLYTDIIIDLNGHTLNFVDAGEINSLRQEHYDRINGVIDEEWEYDIYNSKTKPYPYSFTIRNGKITSNSYYTPLTVPEEAYIAGEGERSRSFRFALGVYNKVNILNVDMEIEAVSTKALLQHQDIFLIFDADITIRNCDIKVNMSSTIPTDAETLYNTFITNGPNGHYQRLKIFQIYGCVINSTTPLQSDNTIWGRHLPVTFLHKLYVDNVNIVCEGPFAAQIRGWYVYGYFVNMNNTSTIINDTCQTITYSITGGGSTLVNCVNPYTFSYCSLYLRNCFGQGRQTGIATVNQAAVFSTSFCDIWLYNCSMHGIRDGISMSGTVIMGGDGKPINNTFAKVIKGGFVSSPGHGGVYTTNSGVVKHFLDSRYYGDLDLDYVLDYGISSGGTPAYGFNEQFDSFIFQDCDICHRVKPNEATNSISNEPSYSGAYGTYLGYFSHNFSDNVNWHVTFQPGFTQNSPVVLNTRAAATYGNTNTGFIMCNDVNTVYPSSSVNYSYNLFNRLSIPITSTCMEFIPIDLKPIVLRMPITYNTSRWSLGGNSSNGIPTGAVAPYITHERPVKIQVYVCNPGEGSFKVFDADFSHKNRTIPAMSTEVVFTDANEQLISGGYVYVVIVPSKSIEKGADSTVYYVPRFTTTNIAGTTEEWLGWTTPQSASFGVGKQIPFSYFYYDKTDIDNPILNEIPGLIRVQFSASNSRFIASNVLRHDDGDMYVGSGVYAGTELITEDNKRLLTNYPDATVKLNRIHLTGQSYRLPIPTPVFYDE